MFLYASSECWEWSQSGKREWPTTGLESTLRAAIPGDESQHGFRIYGSPRPFVIDYTRGDSGQNIVDG